MFETILLSKKKKSIQNKKKYDLTSITYPFKNNLDMYYFINLYEYS